MVADYFQQRTLKQQIPQSKTFTLDFKTSANAKSQEKPKLKHNSCESLCSFYYNRQPSLQLLCHLVSTWIRRILGRLSLLVEKERNNYLAHHRCLLEIVCCGKEIPAQWQSRAYVSLQHNPGFLSTCFHGFAKSNKCVTWWQKAWPILRVCRRPIRYQQVIEPLVYIILFQRFLRYLN